ncbi:TraB/GumN family protein [Cytobacillus sp. FJAT-54145]|uniref:TraB/GumN family protein n=1 Tax=Cytobacillus spartinae TaxID=3299023 RepID=A0ABW6KC62_9BACI
MRLVFKKIAMLLVVALLASAFSTGSAFASTTDCSTLKVVWDDAELKMGQIGRVTILDETELYLLKGEDLAVHKTLPENGVYRVYSFKTNNNTGLYGVGGGYYIKRDHNVLYETPSKAKLAKLKACEQKDEGPKDPVVVAPENEGGFLWKAEHNGNTVYMLGSIHIGSEEFYPLNSKIENAYDASDYLAVEADILNLDPDQLAETLVEKAVYTDGSTLEDHLSDEMYLDLKEALGYYGIAIEYVNMYEPWYVNMLLEGLKPMGLEYAPELGIDYHFLAKATNEDKEIIELEGMEFQLNMFDTFSKEIQLKLLESTLTVEGTEGLKELMDAWNTSDDEAIESILLADNGDNSPEYQEYMTEMLDNRNIGMADKIEQFLASDKKETYFVVVGAAHYFGDMSIIKLLEDKGYEVEKIQ